MTGTHPIFPEGAARVRGQKSASHHIVFLRISPLSSVAELLGEPLQGGGEGCEALSSRSSWEILVVSGAEHFENHDFS